MQECTCRNILFASFLTSFTYVEVSIASDPELLFLHSPFLGVLDGGESYSQPWPVDDLESWRKVRSATRSRGALASSSVLLSFRLLARFPLRAETNMTCLEPVTRSDSTGSGLRSKTRLARAFLLGLLVPLASTHSVKPSPLHPRAISHPSRLSHYIIPRSNSANTALQKRDAEGSLNSEFRSRDAPRWDDKFLLTFESHDQEEPVVLSLRPSQSLVHPEGIKSVERHWNNLTQEWTTLETRISRAEVRAYEGWVIDEPSIDRWVQEEAVGLVRDSSRWREFAKGWARITLHPQEGQDDEEPLKFQGAFEKDGESFTIHSTERYLRTRDELDPSMEDIALEKRDGQVVDKGMVIVRERDILTPTERINLVRKRQLPQLPDPATLVSSSCSHDSLPFNTDPSNPVLANALDQSVFADFHSPWVPFLGLPSPSSSSFSPSDRSALTPISHRSLARRQSTDDISGGSGTSSNFINSIGSTQGCPKSAMVVFLGVAADCTYVESYSGSTDTARRQILDDINQVSALYQQSFNISLGIVELAVMGPTCPSTRSAIDQQNPWNLPCTTDAPVGGSVSKSSIGIDLNSRLNVFSQWRGDKGGADRAGLWHLMTACQTSTEGTLPSLLLS